MSPASCSSRFLPSVNGKHQYNRSEQRTQLLSFLKTIDNILKTADLDEEGRRAWPAGAERTRLHRLGPSWLQPVLPTQPHVTGGHAGHQPAGGAHTGDFSIEEMGCRDRQS